MIHVDEKPEPTDFDRKVRQKGLRWMNKHHIDLNNSLPEKTQLKNYWSDCAEDMYQRYDGCCAYLGLRLNRFQTVTIDHFLPKTKYPMLAYEWSNYRLCSSTVNSYKKDKEGLLDPFKTETGWFCLDFVDGSVYANEDLSSARKDDVDNTIKLLKLNNSLLCKERCRLWDTFKEQPDELKNNAPFIYAEAVRQNKLNVKSELFSYPNM